MNALLTLTIISVAFAAAWMWQRRKPQNELVPIKWDHYRTAREAIIETHFKGRLPSHELDVEIEFKAGRYDLSLGFMDEWERFLAYEAKVEKSRGWRLPLAERVNKFLTLQNDGATPTETMVISTIQTYGLV